MSKQDAIAHLELVARAKGFWNAKGKLGSAQLKARLQMADQAIRVVGKREAASILGVNMTEAITQEAKVPARGDEIRLLIDLAL